MKKVLYTLLFTALMFFGLTRVNALMITFDELEEKGTVIINNKEEIDNIYVVKGKAIFTNIITANDIDALGSTLADVIKYNTEKDTWTDLAGNAVDTSKQIKVLYDVDGNFIEVDLIQDEEELISAIDDALEGAPTLTLAKNIENSKEQININREVAIDGNGKTLHFTKQLIGDAIIVNSDNVSLSNLTIQVDSRRNEGYFLRNLIRVTYANDVTLEDVVLDSANPGITVNESSLTINGKLDLSASDYIPFQISDWESSDHTEVTISEGAQIVNTNESQDRPTIESYEDDAVVDPSKELNENKTIPSNGLTEANGGYYLDEENAKIIDIYADPSDYEMLATASDATTSSNDFYLGISNSTILVDEDNISFKLTGITKPDGAVFRIYDGGTNLLTMPNNVLYSGKYSDFNYIEGKIVADKLGVYTATFALYKGETLLDEETLEFEVVTAFTTYEEPTHIEAYTHYASIDKNYVSTTDTAIVEGKKYYTYSSETGNYTLVTNPTLSEIGNYYEQEEDIEGTINVYTEEANFKGSLSINVLEKPEEDSTVKVYWGSEELVEGTPLNVEFAASGNHTDYIRVEASDEGFYEVDVVLKNESGEEVDTDSLDFEYTDPALTDDEE